MIKSLVISFLDFFYPPFRKLMPEQTYRYAACGSFNTVLDILLYFISYHFVLQKRIIYTPVGAISPHIAALIFSFVISFPIGFYLMRNIVFTGSALRGRVQLFRYFILVMACLLLNYVCIKLFVEQLHIYPTPSKILTTGIVIVFSYITQKKFTFKVQSSGVIKQTQGTQL